jgi:hypothetical protein
VLWLRCHHLPSHHLPSHHRPPPSPLRPTYLRSTTHSTTLHSTTLRSTTRPLLLDQRAGGEEGIMEGAHTRGIDLLILVWGQGAGGQWVWGQGVWGQWVWGVQVGPPVLTAVRPTDRPKELTYPTASGTVPTALLVVPTGRSLDRSTDCRPAHAWPRSTGGKMARA